MAGGYVAAAFVLTTLVIAPMAHAQGNSSVPLPHDTAHAARPVDWCAIHLARRELVQAMSDCDYAVATMPNNSEARSNRGSVWLSAGEPAKALADFEAAIALEPGQAKFHFNRGLAHAKLGKHETAIHDYTEAIRLDPSLAIAYHNRGFEYELRSDIDAALRDYQRAVELAPNLKPPADGIRRIGKGRL